MPPKRPVDDNTGSKEKRPCVEDSSNIIAPSTKPPLALTSDQYKTLISHVADEVTQRLQHEVPAPCPSTSQVGQPQEQIDVNKTPHPKLSLEQTVSGVSQSLADNNNNNNNNNNNKEDKPSRKEQCNRYLRSLELLLLVAFLIIRIVCLILYAVWLWDCFFREFKMAIQCEDFSIYPYPIVATAIWLIIVSLTSLLLIIYVRSRYSEFQGFKATIKHLAGKKYFYQLFITLVLVIIYDSMTIAGGEIEVNRIIVYSCYILEHITAVALMLTLNFVPEFLTAENKWNRRVYKSTLVLYSVENYVEYVMQTILAAYKLVAIPTCAVKEAETGHMPNTDCHDSTAVAMLLLLLVTISLRHTLAQFFLTKFFDENVDVFDIPMQETMQKGGQKDGQEEGQEDAGRVNNGLQN